MLAASSFLLWTTSVVVGLIVFFWLMNCKKDFREDRLELEIMLKRRKQHEDDLNGVIINLETGQTAEEVEFGIFPKKYVSKQVKKTEEDDINEVDNRFELLDL